MKLIIGLFALLLIIAIGGKFYMDYRAGNASLPFVSQTTKATIGSQTFSVLTAVSEEEKKKGLSTRKSLPQDQGMLFEFDQPGNYTFWMKNMQFPIDMIFVNDNRVVAVYPNLQPAGQNDNLALYTAPEPVNMVIEINAGLAQKHNIKKGDEVKIQK